MKKNELIELTKELINASSVCGGAREKAQLYLDSIGTNNEEEMLDLYMNEIKEDITSIDDLISLLESDTGKSIFGEEKCKQMLVHSLERKEKGEKYCDCPACLIAEKIITK